VLKNLLTLSTGELLARGMHALAFVLLARALGEVALGQFGLATAITSYALLVVMQGFDVIAMREVSRETGELRTYVRQILGLRALLAAAAGAAIGAYVLVSRGDVTTGRLLLVLGLSYATNAMSPRWTFLAIEESRPLAVAGLLSQACFLLAAALIRSSAQVLWVAGAQVAGEAVAATFLLWILWRRYGPLTPAFDRTFAAALMRHSWPVTLSLWLGNMFYNFDVVMLGAMGKGVEIGIYLACYRCVTVFTPLLAAFQNSALPWLARSYPDYQSVRRRLYWLTVAATAVLGAAGLVIGVGARDLLTLLFGASYGGGDRILRVLVWVLPLQGARALFRQLLLTYHLQRTDTRNVSLAVVTNIVLDFALIPRFGALGCAISTVCAETVFLACSAISVRRSISRRPVG